MVAHALIPPLPQGQQYPSAATAPRAKITVVTHSVFQQSDSNNYTWKHVTIYQECSCTVLRQQSERPHLIDTVTEALRDSPPFKVKCLLHTWPDKSDISHWAAVPSQFKL